MISTTVDLQYLFLGCINKTISIPGCGGGDVTSLVTGRRLCPAARLIVSTTTESGVGSRAPNEGSQGFHNRHNHGEGPN